MAKNYKARKIIKSVIWIVVLLGIAFGIFFVVKNKDALWSKVTDNTNIYTQEQLDQEKDKAYNQGYLDAHTNNIELKKQVEQYLETIANKDKTITEKENTITQNNQTIEANKTAIEAHKAEIERLKAQAEATSQNHAQAIAELNTQIESLQLQNQTLQNDNAINLATITELNQEKTTLENKVTALSAKIEENKQLIAEYEANKNAWLNSIEYYEQFISALETETQAVAIFEVNGGVHYAQIVTKGTNATVTNPTDTETTSFVGWYVDDFLVEDIKTYPITTNTKFVAKFETTYSVNIMLDINTEFKTIKVAKNGYIPKLETLPSKEGYDFDGLTLNGVEIVDYTTYPITANTTFIAKFTKLHTVTFVADNKVIEAQQVRNGEFAKVVEGFGEIWLFNDEEVDISNYEIYGDITLTQYTGLYKLEQISLDGITDNFYGNCVWSFAGKLYYSNSSKQYYFNPNTEKWVTKKWQLKNPNNGSLLSANFSKSDLWSYNDNLFCSYEAITYKINIETGIGEQYVWNDNLNFSANTVWTDGENYYCKNSSSHYILNKAVAKWEPIEINIENFEARYVWTDGVNTFYSNGTNHYIFDKINKIWVNKEWSGLLDFNGNNVWTDNKNIYYSSGSNQYILDKDTSTWKIKQWQGITSFNGDSVWSNGTNFYLSNVLRHYIFR